jgi:putative lysine transport system substrate-binding protein
LLILTIVLALTFTACSDKQQEVNEEPTQNEEDSKEEFKVGLECNYAPFNWTQSEKTDESVEIDGGGYADGYDVQIAKKIAEGLNRKLVIVKTEWDGLTPAVTSGKIDAIIAGMSPTAERALTIDFTDAYYESDLVVVVKKDSEFANATSLSDFENAKITGQLNTFHYTVIDQIPNVQIQTAMDSFPAMIVALTSGKIDGYISERPGAVSAVESNPDLAFVAFDEGNGFEASPEDISVAVGLKKDSELVEQINEILKGISKEERQEMMDTAVARQPLQQ